MHDHIHAEGSVIAYRTAIDMLCRPNHGGSGIVAWIRNFRKATNRIETGIDAITKAVRDEEASPDEDMDESEWLDKVVKPTKRLLDDLKHLSAGWGKGVIVVMISCGTLVVALLLAALSPSLGEWAQEKCAGRVWERFSDCKYALTGIHAASYIGVAICATGPLTVLYAPAVVSTKCDELKEAINDVRVSDLVRLSQKVKDRGDKRLDLLEKAMALANHGQGVGFRAPIAGVINKKVLGGIAVKVAVSLLTAVVTMVRPQKTFCSDYREIDFLC